MWSTVVLRRTAAFVLVGGVLFMRTIGAKSPLLVLVLCSVLVRLRDAIAALQLLPEGLNRPTPSKEACYPPTPLDKRGNSNKYGGR